MPVREDICYDEEQIWTETDKATTAVIIKKIVYQGIEIPVRRRWRTLTGTAEEFSDEDGGVALASADSIHWTQGRRMQFSLQPFRSTRQPLQLILFNYIFIIYLVSFEIVKFVLLCPCWFVCWCLGEAQRNKKKICSRSKKVIFAQKEREIYMSLKIEDTRI